MKKCNDCGETKPLADFYKNRNGYLSRCIPCHKARMRKAYAKDPEKHIEYQKRYRETKEGREKIKGRAKKYNKLRSLAHHEDPRDQMLRNAKKRAKAMNIPFQLKKEDIQIPARCPVLDIELSVSWSAPSDSSPSLDRIIPELGYIPGNVAVISNKANRIKSDASWEEIQAVASWLKQQKKD